MLGYNSPWKSQEDKDWWLSDTFSNFKLSLCLIFRSVYHLTQLCVPHLIKTKGSIVNVSSVNGQRSVSVEQLDQRFPSPPPPPPICSSSIIKRLWDLWYVSVSLQFPGVLAYCMSKSAIDQFTRCTALGEPPELFVFITVQAHVKKVHRKSKDCFLFQSWHQSRSEWTPCGTWTFCIISVFFFLSFQSLLKCYLWFGKISLFRNQFPLLKLSISVMLYYISMFLSPQPRCDYHRCPQESRTEWGAVRPGNASRRDTSGLGSVSFSSSVEKQIILK